MKKIRLTGIAPWARGGGWRGAFGTLAPISLRVEPIPMPQFDPVAAFLSCTRRTFLVLGAALPAFLRSVVAALEGCTPSRSAVCLFALVLFLPSSTDAQAQTAPEITSGGPFTVAEGTTAVTTLTASDEDTASDQLVWTIPEEGTGGADADQFTLDSTGVLAFSAAKDYENPDDADGDRTYEVTVQVSDGDNPVTADIRVTLQNVLELSTELTGPSSPDYAENGATRVATYIASSPEDNGDVAWSLLGADSGGFSIDGGALRFLSLPDYESPSDVGTDNTYSVTVAASDGISNLTKDVTVTVTDRDEVGALTLSSTVPRLGTALTAAVTDPDGVTAGTVTWEWERSTGPGAWVVIDGATAASYRPTAADTNAFLRVTATYDDEHGSGHSAQKSTSNVVTGPLLTALQVTTDAAVANPARAMNPAFGKETLHYAIGCNNGDTMQVTLRAPSDARVAVDGRVPSGNSTGDMTATVEVTPTSDVPISVTDSNGAHTVYHVHCLNAQFYQIEAGRYAGAEGVFEGLLLFRHARYLVMMDNNGVPRFRETHADARSRTWFFRVGPDGVYRYAYATQNNRFDVLNQHLKLIDSRISVVFPLSGTDQHAFAILPNGNYLLMAYEWNVRNLSHLTFTNAEGNPYTFHSLYDSAIQITTPDEREALFTWDSWGKMPLEDCVQHRFAGSPFPGYAHLNSLQMVGDDTIVGSFRGCSKVLGIDATTGAVAWRVGRTNLSDEEWASRDIGPAPLIPVNDPEGEFCGQHSATILPNGHLLLYDNGAVCLIDPWTRESVRTDGLYSRAVEYALDHDAGEAVFVRDHSLHGNKAAFGYSSGQVVPMDNGDWLISWGRNLRGQRPLEETVTQVDPATGQEKFFIRFTEENTEERPYLMATSVPADALTDTPGPLTAEIAESASNSAAHTGPFDKPKVVVAFSRPVVDFTAATAPVSLTGATLDSVSALVSAGEAANAYLFTLTPGGDGPISFNLVSGRSCASGGICTADGTTLSEVSAPRVIPRAPIRLIAAPDALEIREGTTAVYSVVFNENPAQLYGVECGDDVWVQVKHAEGTDVTLDRYSHPVSSGDGNCDGGNWSQRKSFQVSANRDDDADKDPLVTLTHEVWNTRAETVLTGPNVTVSIIEGVDLEAPRIEGIEITSDPPDGRDVYGIGEEVEVTVTFSEIVMVTETPRVTLKVGERDRSANYESVTGAELVFAYTVAVNDSDADGVSLEADSLSGGTIRDPSGNDAVRTHSAVAADTGQKVDGIKPVLASTGGAVANGTMLTLAYGEPLDSSSVPGNDAFTVTGGSETRTVTGVRVSGNSVELTLTPAVEHGETGLRVSYTVPAGMGATPIQDRVGNDADGLSSEPVTNQTPDRIPPTVISVEITSDPPDGRDVYGAGEEIEVTVTFSETVLVTGTPRVTLKVGARDRSANYESVTGAVVLFAYTVATNDSDTDGVSVEADSLSGGTIRDPSRNNALRTHSAVAADTGQQVDGIKPVLASTDGAVANGTMLTLAYSEPLDTSSAPGNDAFSVTGGNETRSVTGVRVSGSAVELTLTPAVEHGETGLRVSYTVPTGSVAAPIQDTAGNDAARLSNRSVTNDTGDTTGPAVEMLRITSNAGSDSTYAVGDPIEVTVTFNESVVVTGTPRLTVNVGGQNRRADYLSVTGAAVKFEYRVARGDSDRDGVSIDADSLSGGGGTIRDGAQNDATLTHAGVAADSRHKVDGIPPALATTDGAVVNGTTLTLAYSEPLNSSSRPAASAFTVTGGNEARTVTRVQVSGSEVLLTLNPAVTDGESGLRLSYQPGENPIEDTVGNAADGLNNQPVTNNTGDTTGPTVETVRITSNAGSDATYAAGETIEVTVTFSATVVVTGTPRLTLNLGGRSRTANYQDVTGAAVRFEYQVVSGDTAPYGVSIDANRLSGGTIRDGARNDAVRNHAPVPADSRHQVDGIRPTLATSDGAVASGTTLTLAYGEALDSSSVPATDDFTVTGGSETRTVTGVRVSGSAVFLTLSPAVADGERGLRVSYEPGSDPIQDTAGNDADRLSNKSVTNRTGDTTGPAVSTVRITSSAGSDRTYGVDETIEVTVTFDETVVVTGTPQLTLNLGGRSGTANFRSVKNQAVKFAYRVVPGDNDGDGVSIDADSLSRGTGTIRDGAQNDATLDHAAVAADARHQVDGILPVLATTDGAVVNGTKLTLAYSEPLNSSSRPAASAFTVTGGG